MFIFLDIETVKDNKKVDERLIEYHYNKYIKTSWLDSALYTQEMFLEERAWLYPEIGKICCISVWYETWLDSGHFVTKSYVNTEEDDLLWDFLNDMNKFAEHLKWNITLVGHNIKNFDMPFLCKRIMKHYYPLEKWLWQYTKKPWEQNIVDTYEMSKCWGMDWLSLHAACLFVGAKSPKDWGDWSKVQELYDQWRLNDIGRYCEWDVYATRQVFGVFSTGSHSNVDMSKTASRTIWEDRFETKEAKENFDAQPKQEITESVPVAEVMVDIVAEPPTVDDPYAESRKIDEIIEDIMHGRANK